MLGFGCKIRVSLRWIGEICAVVGDQLVLSGYLGWLACSLFFCPSAVHDLLSPGIKHMRIKLIGFSAPAAWLIWILLSSTSIVVSYPACQIHRFGTQCAIISAFYFFHL